MESASLTIGEFLERTASKDPTPGGGGVAGVTGALAAALGEMVLAFSIGKKGLEDHQARLADCSRSVGAMRNRLLELADEDAAAYAKLNSVMKLQKDSPERKTELPKAALDAARVPLDVIRVSSELVLCFEVMAEISNPWLKSDLAIAAILTEAVARASRWNIVVNMGFMDGQGFGLLEDADGLLERIQTGSERTVAACA
ncbi:MAG: cyclodeaminase/cyclohydrolase family protein [Phycisphaerales bacterium]